VCLAMQCVEVASPRQRLPDVLRHPHHRILHIRTDLAEPTGTFGVCVALEELPDYWAELLVFLKGLESRSSRSELEALFPLELCQERRSRGGIHRLIRAAEERDVVGVRE
jgi:hypothetical protein